MGMLRDYREAYINQNVQFILVDPEGQVIESDRSFLNIGQSDLIYEIHPFFESFRLVADSKEKELTYNCVHIASEGTDFILDIKLIQRSEGILIVLYNMTNHYISHQKIAQARNESVIRNELVVLKNIELEEREKFKNAFIQNFSHELRNPLTSVISITNIIEGTRLTTEQQEMVNFLKASNSHLKLMLEDVMSISMISSGKLQLREKVFNLYDLLQLIRFTYSTRVKETLVDFNLILDEKVPELVIGDRLRLFQILTNLLDNAFKFSEKGTVALKVQLNQKRANKVNLGFEVSDEGLGIPEEKQHVIFESFSQLERHGKQQGVGLGLSIVKGLLERMGSSIQLRSTVDKGSVFRFDLSVKYPLDLSSEPIVKDEGRNEAKKINTSRKYKLLLVEDDDRVQTVLFKYLTSTNLFFIDLVNDGSKVLEEIISNEYDIILMDVDLPNISGDQITKLIRDFPFKNISDIPVIGISANAFEEHFKSYMAKGMNTVVTKPFDLQDLVDTILSYLK